MAYFFNFNKMQYLKDKRNSGCKLCQIQEENQATPNLVVYKDDYFAVAVNLYPYNPGHLLIFPVRHIEDIRSYSGEEETRLTRLIKFFLDILDKTHEASGYNIGYNMGHVAGASIDHVHLHVIPRYPNELGIADLIAGKRVLVENPYDTKERILKAIPQDPFSIITS